MIVSMFINMYPWVLCLLSAKSEDLLSKTSPVVDAESSVWWSPVEPSSDLDGFQILEGDILMPADATNSNLKNAIKSKEYLWEKGIIPYEFHSDFNCEEKDQILDAMKVLESNTCIRFVERNTENNFIRFQKERNGCYATIGRLAGNEGPLPVNLQSPECLKKRGIIEHELLHVIGLFHEQSRPDRDDFVNIHWCNIEANKESNFRKGTTDEMTTFNLPYDYYSIMHYPKWAFSKNGKPTITAKENPDMALGQRERPSESDFEKVIQMYGCNLTESNSPTAEKKFVAAQNAQLY